MVIRRNFFPVLVLSLLLAACGRKASTPPVSGEQLRLDCIRLLQLPEGEIPKDTWPKSVAELKPLKVERQSDRIAILQRHEDRKFSQGYYVFADPQSSPSTRGVWIQRTEWKGVFIFKTQY